MCFLFRAIFPACLRNHFKSKFKSLDPIVQRYIVKYIGDAVYLHSDIAWLMFPCLNNSNQLLESGKAVANSLTLTPWIGKCVVDVLKSDRVNHNLV